MLAVLVLLFCPAAGVRADHHVEPCHVLLLHSYHPGMTWVENIEDAVYDVLDPADNGLVLHIEYLDSKRVHDQIHYDRFARMLAHKYRDLELSLVLCSDNNAFDFLMRRGKALFPGVPMVFCGVNDFSPEMIAGHPGVTGVAESPSTAETVEVMLRLFPETDSVYVINDHLTTGRAWTRSIKKELAPFEDRIRVEYNENLPIAGLQERIHSLPPGTLVLLGVYFADRDGRYFTYEKLGSMLTSISPVPVFCLLRFNLRDGVVGGKVINGYSQGAMMSELAGRVLAGEAPFSIPVRTEGANRFTFDSAQLTRFGLSESLLPESSLVINRPFSFYETYKRLVWATAAVFLFLLVLIVLLVQNILSRKRSEKMLRLSEIKYRSIFDNATEGIFQSTPDGGFLDANPAMARILGFSSPQEILNECRDISSLYEDPADRMRLREKLLAQGEVTGWELRMIRWNGRPFWASVNIHLVKEDESGGEYYYEGTLDDITERKEYERTLLEQEAELRAHRDNLEKLVERRTEELRQNEIRHRTLFQASADAIVTIRDKRFANCNQAALSLLGVQSEGEVLGMTFEDWSPERQPDGSPSGEKLAKMTVRAEEAGTVRFEWTLFRADGKPLPLEIQLTALEDGQGGRIFNAAWRDLTGKKRAEEQLARAHRQLQSVLDAATQVAIIATDPSGIIRVFNTGAERMLGYSASETVGIGTPEMFHLPSELSAHAEQLEREYGEPVQGFEVFLARARRGGCDEREWTYVRKDGTRLSVNLAVTAMVDDEGRVTMMLGVATDISERKRAQEEVATLNRELELRVRERTAELQVANSELESFSYSMSHDLRTPLRGISGFAHLLDEDYAEELGDEGRQYLDRIMFGIERMSGLIDDIVRLGEVTRAELRLEEVDLSALAGDLLGRLAGNDPERRVETEVREGLTARADRKLVRILLDNLLQNAWKFTRRNGDPRVEFGGEIRNGRQVFRVRDNGVGFDMSYARKLFKPFNRLHGIEEFKGAGIGLAIARRTVERHGGQIWVEAAMNRGATFFFTLEK